MNLTDFMLFFDTSELCIQFKYFITGTLLVCSDLPRNQISDLELLLCLEEYCKRYNFYIKLSETDMMGIS